MGAVTNTVSILVWHCTLLNADDLLLVGVGFFVLKGPVRPRERAC